MRKIVFAALCAFAAVAVSCKNDRESDVNPGDSDIDGLYINEVYSCNPDWVELYNARSCISAASSCRTTRGRKRSTSYRKVRR